MNESPDDARADEEYRKYLAQSWWPQPPVDPQQLTVSPGNTPLPQSHGPQPPPTGGSENWRGGDTRPPRFGAGPYQAAPDPAQHWPSVSTGLSAGNSPQPPASNGPSTWRSIGIGALGLMAGLFAAFVLQDVLGMVFVLNGGSFPLGIAAVIGSFMPMFAVAGVVVALLIDRKARARRLGSSAADRK